MKIGLVGEFSSQRDEGLKNIGMDLAHLLERDHAVTRFDLTRISDRSQWTALRDAKVDILHYVTGNTSKSLVLARALATYARAPYILSCPHPHFSSLYRHARPLARVTARLIPPSRVLVQSAETQRHFEQAGLRTDLLPNGIDITRFSPVDASHKAQLRSELALPASGPVALHVGHLRRVRNLGVMAALARNGFHAVVVASQRLPADEDVEQELRAAGVDVRVGYESAVERYYRASDVYVFPVPLEHTIQTPLSVLEALACGTPAVVRAFEGLKALAPDGGNALQYISSDEETPQAVARALKATASEARSLAERASLDHYAARLVTIYKEVASP